MSEHNEAPDPRLVAISEKIKRIRKEAGYTNYEHIAWELGIGRAQYHRLERGENFTMKTLFRLLDGYGISLEEFFAEFKEAKEPFLEKVVDKK